MAVISVKTYFLTLAFISTTLLWGVSLWNGTVKELILTAWRGEFEDGASFKNTYTGLFILDFPLSLLVAFFFYGTSGRDNGYQNFLIDAYSTLQSGFVWLYVESGRKSQKPFLIANPIIFALLWQAIGAAIIFPLYFSRHLEWINTQPSELPSVSLPFARALPFSFIAGAIVPAIVGMLPTWVDRSPKTHQNILAFWQLDPIWVSIIQCLVVILFSGLISTNSQKRTSRWVQTTYVFAAISSATGHLYATGAMLMSKDPDMGFGRVYIPHLFSGVAGVESRLINGTWLFLQYDHILIAVSILSWAYLLVAQLKLDKPGLDANLLIMFLAGALSLGPANILVIDADKTVGGVWSQERLYPNLVAQVRLGLFNYTDTPMKKQGATKNNMITGKMIHDYLQKYAEDHDLLRRIRFGSFVEEAKRCPRGWRLKIKDSNVAIETEKLMVATGVTSIPNMPVFKENDGSVPLIHSKDLGTKFQGLETEGIQNVVVLGAAKSAYDAVYLLLSLGKKVTWIIRPDGAGPLAILPAELFGVNCIAVASTRLMTFLSPSILNASGSMSSFFHRSILGKWCASKFWDLVTYISDTHAGYAKGDHVAELKPEIDGKSAFWANSGLGVVTLPDFWSSIHEGDVTIMRENLDTVKEGKLHFRSGKTLETDYLVACTGWADHFGMFDDETKVDLGLPLIGKTSVDLKMRDAAWAVHNLDADKSVSEKLPLIANTPGMRNRQAIDAPQRRWRLYRRVVPLSAGIKNDRSIAILGQIHTVQTPLVSEMQSFWAILYLLGEIELPDEATMTKEIAEWNAWTRKRYLSQGQKFPYSLFDFLSADVASNSQYVDVLCRDMGINSHRKGNMVSELFSPYQPEDFNGFVDEYLDKRQRKSEEGIEV
ncbi:hypothetical protein B7494_g2487 [Chlorociboria aeruginascens]|nr:hypothetical protein B7494_g2487 [Chlorociboria aeruginascens]